MSDMPTIAWLHVIKEPYRTPAKLLSASPDNPWSHWVASHLEQCEYSCTPLIAVPQLLALIADEQRRVTSPEAVGALANVKHAINAMME